MKSEVNLASSVFATFLLGLVVSGCCGVRVDPGNAIVAQGSPITVTATRIAGQCNAPLQIQSSEWSLPRSMIPVAGDPLKYSYTFEGKDIKDTFEYRICSVQKGGGPYRVSVNGPPQCVDLCRKGYDCALQYRKRELEAYRLVLLMHPMSDPDRAEFLRGFETAYAEANDAVQGERCVDILKKSLTGGLYEQAFGHGQKHVNNEVPDVAVQDFMRRATGLSVATTLGWEAGYIEGFVKGKFDPRVHDKESLYEEAETMYRVLRAGAAL